jgi:hypothetical protein
MALPATVKDTTASLPPNPPVPPSPSSPPAPARPPVRPLEARRLKLVVSSASDIQNGWAIVVPAGTSVETILSPEFYSSVASQLRIGDFVDVHSDGRDFVARLYVRETSKTRASVALIGLTRFDALIESFEPAAHRVKYAGPHAKWTVERIGDGRAVKDGYESREDAETAMKGRVPARPRNCSSKFHRDRARRYSGTIVLSCVGAPAQRNLRSID